MEMRLGLNAIRITAEAERDWQRRMQEPREDFETRAVERAVKAGDAAARSSAHVSKRRRAESDLAFDKALRQRGGLKQCPRRVCGRPATLLAILAFSHASVLTSPWPYDGMDL